MKELRVGLILGAVMAVVAFGRAWLLGVGSGHRGAVAHHDPRDLPVVGDGRRRRCRWCCVGCAIDPAVVSAPLITTLVDGTGLIIYFQIAKLVLRV